MNINSCPLAVLYGYISGSDELSFVGRNGIICLKGNSTEIDQVLRQCNGVTSIKDISLAVSSLTIDEVVGLISLLEQNGIIRESRELYRGFHEDSSNPASFVYDLGDKEVSTIANLPRLRDRAGKCKKLPTPPASQVLKIVSQRKSTRGFRSKAVSLRHLSGLLETAYGISKTGHWSVPSGGALYPLDIYVVALNVQSLMPGIYRWVPESKELSVVSESNPNVWINKTFNAKALLENVSFIVCVAGDLRRPTMKYANRGYRNVLLEVGHLVQNVNLYCAENVIGVVEYVGFNEKSLANMLGLNFLDEPVISTLIIGYPDDNDLLPALSLRFVRGFLLWHESSK